MVTHYVWVYIQGGHNLPVRSPLPGKCAASGSLLVYQETLFGGRGKIAFQRRTAKNNAPVVTLQSCHLQGGHLDLCESWIFISGPLHLLLIRVDILLLNSPVSAILGGSPPSSVSLVEYRIRVLIRVRVLRHLGRL